jgi:hypothetical protein
MSGVSIVSQAPGFLSAESVELQLGRVLNWEAETEDTVLSVFTFDPNISSVEFNQFLDKG